MHGRTSHPSHRAPLTEHHKHISHCTTAAWTTLSERRPTWPPAWYTQCQRRDPSVCLEKRKQQFVDALLGAATAGKPSPTISPHVRIILHRSSLGCCPRRVAETEAAHVHRHSTTATTTSDLPSRARDYRHRYRVRLNDSFSLLSLLVTIIVLAYIPT